MASNTQNGAPPQGAPRALSGLARRAGRHDATRTALPTLATTVVVVAALYFGREVFMPIGIALLITFALAPAVAALRRTGIPRLAAVIASVFSAFAALAIFSFVVVTQVGELAQNIVSYQTNILSKIATLKETGAGSGIVERLSRVIERVGREIEKEDPRPPEPGEAPEPEPVPVEIVSSQKPIEVLRSLITPLISPLATAGLIIVVVIFMLLEREDLRDRFIRLAGYGDLHRTTEALQDAGRRVGQYLLMQLVVNVTYAIPVDDRAVAARHSQRAAVGIAGAGAALRSLYRPGHRHAAARRSLAFAVAPGLVAGAVDGGAVRGDRADQQQRRRAVALRLADRAFAARDHRGRDLLDLALGADRPGPVDAAHRLPRRARAGTCRSSSSSTCCSATSRCSSRKRGSTSACWPAIPQEATDHAEEYSGRRVSGRFLPEGRHSGASDRRAGPGARRAGRRAAPAGWRQAR